MKEKDILMHGAESLCVCVGAGGGRLLANDNRKEGCLTYLGEVGRRNNLGRLPGGGDIGAASWEMNGVISDNPDGGEDLYPKELGRWNTNLWKYWEGISLGKAESLCERMTFALLLYIGGWCCLGHCVPSYLFNRARPLRGLKWNEVTQSCPTLCDPRDCSLPDSSIHGIFQARILEWVAISFSRRSSWCMNWTWISYIVRCITIWVTREVRGR